MAVSAFKFRNLVRRTSTAVKGNDSERFKLITVLIVMKRTRRENKRNRGGRREGKKIFIR